MNCVDRNIITRTDLLSGALADSATRGDGQAVPGGAQRSADDYWAKLAKYVPIEIISAYLLIDGLIRSGTSSNSARWWLLLGFLVAGVVATWFFARRVLGVVRSSQTSMSCIGFVVWVLATGGWFALQPWYGPWIGTGAVIVFGVLAQIVNVPPLPSPPAGSESSTSR
jgi:branched-subunit amino acid transport protein